MTAGASIHSAHELIDAYDGVLLDAYGVLVDKTGALPGVPAFVERLLAAGKPFLVLTNSASRLPETITAELLAAGLSIPAERILTSGMLLAAYFRQHGLQGAACLVLGPGESEEYVRRAGGKALSPWAEPIDPDTQVVVIADQKGYPCLEVMDRTLSLVLNRLDTGRSVHLLLCNPDLIYPVRPGRYGFTAGGLAAMLEAVIRERYPEREDPIVRLGKPYPPLFEAARDLIAAEHLVMLGDQLATDILGANRCGIDSVLVGTGLARNPEAATPGVAPTAYLPSLIL